MRRRKRRKVYYFSQWESSSSLPNQVNGRKVKFWKQVGGFRLNGHHSDDESSVAPFVPIYNKSPDYELIVQAVVIVAFLGVLLFFQPFTEPTSENQYVTENQNYSVDMPIQDNQLSDFDDYFESYKENSSKSYMDFDVNLISQKIFLLVNEQRTKPLSWNDSLALLAKNHSDDMFERNFYDHINPDEDDVTARAKKAGISTEKDLGDRVQIGLGENLTNVVNGDYTFACGFLENEDQIAECAVKRWQKSPPHYSNFLDTDYDETGVGVAQIGNEFYFTQVFR